MAKKQSLGLQLITWNGEDFLEEILESIIPYVEQVVIADEGSVDSTPDILKRFQDKYPNITILTSDIKYDYKYAEERRTLGVDRNTKLSEAYNNTRHLLKTDWILKIDDDEIFYPELMKEVIETINSGKEHEVYSIPFVHFENHDTMLNPSAYKGMFMARLFKNLPKYYWSGKFGDRVITSGNTRLSSRKCPKLINPFLHIGSLRKEERRHDYRFSSKEISTIPTPTKYYEHLPKKN